MKEELEWYHQLLYEQAWENYRNEDENLRTILTQYLVFLAAFIYAITQIEAASGERILAFIGMVVSVITILYIGRVAHYSRLWLSLKDKAISKDLAKSEAKQIKRRASSAFLRLLSWVPGYILILAFPIAGFILFFSIMLQWVSFTS